MRGMPDTEREDRYHEIEVAKAEATRLLNTAKHPSMKVPIYEAMRDLDEAAGWLIRARVPAEQRAALGFADFRIHLAKERLRFVDDWLTTWGPDVMHFT